MDKMTSAANLYYKQISSYSFSCNKAAKQFQTLSIEANNIGKDSSDVNIRGQIGSDWETDYIDC